MAWLYKVRAEIRTIVWILIGLTWLFYNNFFLTVKHNFTQYTIYTVVNMVPSKYLFCPRLLGVKGNI